MSTIAFLASGEGTASGTHTATGTPAVGDLIVVVCYDSGANPSTAPTDDNADGLGTYTSITSCLAASSVDLLRIYVRDALIGSATSTIFTSASGATTGGGLSVAAITGVTRVGSNAVRQSAKLDNQVAGTPVPGFTVAPLTANVLLGAVLNATNPAGMTARSSPAWTELSDVGWSLPPTGAEVMGIASGETSVSIAWGSASVSAFGAAVIELDTSTPSPTINTQPVSQTANVGGASPTFTVAATTTGGALHYQWKDDGANVGSDSASYSPTVTAAMQGAQITCDVSDSNGTTTTLPVTLTVAWTVTGTGPRSYPIMGGGPLGAGDIGSWIRGPEATGAVTHASSGDLIAAAAVVAGTAAHVALHPSSGALVAGDAVVTGTAARTRVHLSSGALVAGDAIVVGTAAQTRVHLSSGALVAGDAIVAGTAAQASGSTSHDSSGALVADAAVVSGTAEVISTNPVVPAQTGAPGRPDRYVVFIDGKRYIGDMSYIQSVIEESAEQHAIAAITKAKTPTKPRIVVQSGRKVSAPEMRAPEAVTIQVQKDVRDYYNLAYAKYMLELEQDEEDALMVLL